MRRSALQRFAQDRSGIAATEFAIVAPFLIVMIFAAFSLFQIVRASYVADKSTFTISDLVSRQTQTSNAQLGQMKAVFDRLVIDIGEAPQLRVTSLIRTAAGYVVDWSYNSVPGGTLAKSDVPLADLPDIAVNDSILLTESIVSVQPFMEILPVMTAAAMTFSYAATTRPRFVGRLVKID